MRAEANPRSGASPLLILTCMAFASVALVLSKQSDGRQAWFNLATQDWWLLLVATLVCAVCSIKLAEGRNLPFLGRKHYLIGASVAGLVAYLGHYLVLSGYDLSRDEQMASFDAAVFATGRLVAPLPAEWARHADALNTMFMYPAEIRSAWISAYLPGNALMRAGFSWMGDAALTGPAMILLGALALWGCVRKLWPQDKAAPFVAGALYLCSGQVLITGMTSYAMPAHLALNLVWFWLFLQRRWRADIAALVVAFLATGLHQPIMHPIFAAPILFLVVLERHWARAALFFAGYLAIGLFWWMWPIWMIDLVGTSGAAGSGTEFDYLSRLVAALGDDFLTGLLVMAANLLRFAAWQHLLLVPLVLYGVVAARRERMVWGLAGGIVLMIAIMAVILPDQGHGFGYRYLHGFIGSAILLAVYGWKSLGQQMGLWNSYVLRATAATLLVLLPIQLWLAHGSYAPYARASETMGALEADFVVIGATDAPYTADLVYNPPALEQRPLRLLRHEMDAETIGFLCRNGPSVALANASDLAPIAGYYGQGVEDFAKANRTLAQRLTASGCSVLERAS